MMIICAKLFSNPVMHKKIMGRTRTGFTEVYAQSLSAGCDFDFCSSDMVLVCDTSSCHDDHLCQIIFKSHHVQLSYGPDTILEYTNSHTWTGNTLNALPPFHSRGIKAEATSALNIYLYIIMHAQLNIEDGKFVSAAY